MTLKFSKLKFKVYEFETLKFIFDWLLQHRIYFKLNIRQSRYEVPVYKFKINLLHIKQIKLRRMLKDIILNKEELYGIQYIE